MPAVAVAQVIADAAAENNAFLPGQAMPIAQQTFFLSRLNLIIDSWNAQRDAVWCDIFSSYTLTPNLSPHTIGPSGATWTIAVRPVTLDGCFLNLNTQIPNVFVEIDRIDKDTYERYIAVPGIATSVPTCVYYEQDWPKGKLFFYPVPNYAYAVRISTRTLLAQVAYTDSVDFPPGYQQALTLTLAEDTAAGLGASLQGITVQRAREARARIFANNTQSPVLNFRDGQQDDRRSNYNYHDRSFT